jgi:hypothetical protein
MYRQNYPQMDQIYRDAKAVLQDKPSEGWIISPGLDFRRYLTYATDDTPGFYIYYTYDNEHIYMHQIKKVDL